MPLTTFDIAIGFILAVEQEYSNIPSDPGNWTGGAVGSGINKGTKWGISAKAYPALDIANLSLDDCKAIYLRDYWNKCRCGDVPSPVGIMLMDAAVNQGQGTSVKILQAAVRVPIDGVIGPATIQAASSGSPIKTAGAFMARRLYLYGMDKGFSANGAGWCQRVADCFILAISPPTQ